MPAGRLDAALDLSWEERVDQASFKTQVQGAQTVSLLKQTLVAVEQIPLVLQEVPPFVAAMALATWEMHIMVQQLAEAVIKLLSGHLQCIVTNFGHLWRGLCAWCS